MWHCTMASSILQWFYWRLYTIYLSYIFLSSTSRILFIWPNNSFDYSLFGRILQISILYILSFLTLLTVMLSLISAHIWLECYVHFSKLAEMILTTLASVNAVFRLTALCIRKLMYYYCSTFCFMLNAKYKCPCGFFFWMDGIRSP